MPMLVRGLAAALADEVGWLRHLAAGETVAGPADRAGYPERMLFRLLAGAYAKGRRGQPHGSSHRSPGP